MNRKTSLLRLIGLLAVVLIGSLIFAGQAYSAASAINGDLDKDVVQCDGKTMGTDPKLRCVPAEYARLPGAGSTRDQMKESMRKDAAEESRNATLGGIGAAVLGVVLIGLIVVEVRRRRTVGTAPAGGTRP